MTKIRTVLAILAASALENIMRAIKFLYLLLSILIIASCNAKNGPATVAKEGHQVKGFNSSGEKDSCPSLLSADMMCTLEFTAEDQFAIDCRKGGGVALQCGCHHYLCSENLAK